MAHLLKAKKQFKNLCRQEIQILFTEMSLIKTCFQHDIAYSKSKGLTKSIPSDKVSRDKEFKIASDPKCDGY